MRCGRAFESGEGERHFVRADMDDGGPQESSLQDRKSVGWGSAALRTSLTTPFHASGGCGRRRWDLHDRFLEWRGRRMGWILIVVLGEGDDAGMKDWMMGLLAPTRDRGFRWRGMLVWKNP